MVLKCMSKNFNQPPIELALGTTLQIREPEGKDMTIVEIRDSQFNKVELKRFENES